MGGGMQSGRGRRRGVQDLPPFISPRQFTRVTGLLRAMDAGLRSSEAGRAMGIGSGNMSNFLMRLFDTGTYPPPREQVVALLTLPVVSAAEARRMAHRGGLDVEREAPLDGAEIERRKRAVEAERAAREAYWLQVEADKYGLPRPGRPLSGMVA